MSTNNRLWYQQPANRWQEALPLGNGRIGAMVFGDPQRERLQLNEDTLWSGYPRDERNREALAHLPEARRLIFDGQYKAAQDVIEAHMVGTWSQSYQPLGDLWIDFAEHAPISDYERELDISTAVCTTRFTRKGVRFTQETFISAVDQVLMIRISGSQPGSVQLDASLTSTLNHSVGKIDNATVGLDGCAPAQVFPPSSFEEPEPIYYEEGKGMTFALQLHARVDGGRVDVFGNRCRVSSADSVTFIVTTNTSFDGYDKDPRHTDKDPAALCRQQRDAVAAVPFETLKARHITDHDQYFSRVSLDFGSSPNADLPTDERIRRLRAGEDDPQLATLFFHYSRYLLIVSSRPGTQPTTLQGIWNDNNRPPWCCNYTTNINVEMNYWLAEPCNLAEMHTPLFDMLADLSVTGQQMAEMHYGTRGWAVHHSAGLWRTAVPSDGSASWAFWPMAGVWMCQHLWAHYDFGRNRTFLAETAYPLMKGAALFCLDWLIEGQDGWLVTNPSTSPENVFIAPDGSKSAVTQAATMDVALIWELFSNCIAASEILGVDETLRAEWEEKRDRLPPLQIGRNGQLQEWLHDFEEAYPEHRHVAHIYPLHPGAQIQPLRDPALTDACRVTMERRLRYEGQDTIGWCFSWYTSIFARLLDGATAYDFYDKLVKNAFPNLLNAHRHPRLKVHPTQLEANYAAAAGVVEMLLQSHAGAIHLLPALPDAWLSGSVRGLRARGGFELDFAWESGRVTSATIRSQVGERCVLRVDAGQVLVDGEVISAENNLITFDTQPNRAYQLVFE